MTPITDEMNMASVESEPEVAEPVESADFTALEFSVAEAVSKGPVESAGPGEAGSTEASSSAETVEIAPAVDPAMAQTIAERELRGIDRKSTRLNSSHMSESRMPSSA